ncbi:MAG TPA: VacJ family lipoprotein [Allosphingosinicella sp.]|nr:VacJ family lipoprotein [Allosphingosinicella sp.]
MRAILALLLAATLSACATTRGSASLDEPDPYEGFNRGVFAFNQAVDKVAIKPASTLYRAAAPIPARRGISRVFANLTEPFSFINNLLQGKPKRAVNSLGRFIINSTIGVGGLADHATDLGIPRAKEDFGQTLAVAGARRSPYLVLPVLGPSTVRDAVGTAVQFVADPGQAAVGSLLSPTEGYVVTGTRFIDSRSQATDAGADTLVDTSADPYAAVRSAYFQRRNAEILDQESGGVVQESDEDELLRRTLEDDAVTEGGVVRPEIEGEARPQPPASEESPPEPEVIESED